MYETFKRARDSLRGVIPWAFTFGKGMTLLYSSRSDLRSAGFFRSVASRRPVRADGTPLPWMNYCAISFLEERLGPELTIFEYGSGNSTLFFAERVASVVALEADRKWYDYVRGEMPANVTMLYHDPAEPGYVDAIATTNRRYDIVIVDADERVACLLNSPDHLSERGVVILDDAQREEYQQGCAQMRAKGFRQLNLEGLKPAGIRFYRTTIFYRDGNCLGL